MVEERSSYSSVDRQRRGRDPRGGVAQQIQYTVGDIRRMANTPKWHCFPAGLLYVGILQVGRERCFDRARSNRVNADAVLRLFEGHLLGQ
jgi:hypothetical protein